MFCRLYFAATSGVCLLRSGAAGFSKETTFAKEMLWRSVSTHTRHDVRGSPHVVYRPRLRMRLAGIYARRRAPYARQSPECHIRPVQSTSAEVSCTVMYK